MLVLHVVMRMVTSIRYSVTCATCGYIWNVPTWSLCRDLRKLSFVPSVWESRSPESIEHAVLNNANVSIVGNNLYICSF